MKNNIFLILGGDNRSLYVGEYLEKQGLNVCYYAFRDTDCFESLNDAIKDASVIILPLPVSKDRLTLNAPLFDETIPLSEIGTLLTSQKIVFGGQLPKSFCEELDDKNIFYCDYFLLDELSFYNAVPTAEGVVNILIEALPITIHGMHCAITGYGKTGKVLSKTLKAMGADVTVFARREEALAQAFCDGIKGKYIHQLKTEQHSFDALVNTVPVKILDNEALSCLNPDCILIEIASSPFGIDFQAAKEKAIEVIKAGSLPGKIAPKTAGGIIGRSILPIIKQRGLAE